MMVFGVRPRGRTTRLASLAFHHPLNKIFSISQPTPPTTHSRNMSVKLPPACLQRYTSIWAEIKGTKNYDIEQAALTRSIDNGDDEQEIKAELESEFEELCDRAYEELCKQPGWEYMTEDLQTAWYERWVWGNMGGTQSPFPGNSDALIAFEDWYFVFEQGLNNSPAENLPAGWYPVDNPSITPAPRMQTPNFPETWPAGPGDAPWKDVEGEVEATREASIPSPADAVSKTRVYTYTTPEVNGQPDTTPSDSEQATPSQATTESTTPFPDVDVDMDLSATIGLATSISIKQALPKTIWQYFTDSDSDDEGGVPVTPHPSSSIPELDADALIGTRVRSAETEDRYADGEDEETDGGVRLEWY